MMRLGEEGVRQGAEERSSLLSKLLFSRQPILDFFDFELYFWTFSAWRIFFSSSLGKYFLKSFSPRYQGRCKGSVTDKGKMKSPFRFGTFSGLVKLNEEVRYCSVKNWKWMRSTFRTIMLNEIYKHLAYSFLKFQISASSPFLCLDQEPLHLLRSPGIE